ncbi:MAG TPA: hypothetical protein VFV75_13230 [Candidatus Polarisedimenticolaceae bacterium]|nr:hypothetical protein [Candidatus Polarisedimenticolaceae bacterium]
MRSLPLGLLLFACVFVAFGIHLLRAGGDPGFERAVVVLVGLGAVAIGIGLWRRDMRALRGYVLWSGISLALGFWHELSVAREPLAVVLVWLVLGALLYGAVGLYLRDALRAARPQAG